MRVTEQDWKNDYVIGPLAVDAQHIIDGFVNPTPAPAPVQQAEQEIQTEAAVS